MKVIYGTSDYPPTSGGIAEFARSLTQEISKCRQVDNIKVIRYVDTEEKDININQNQTIINIDAENIYSKIYNIGISIYENRDYDIFHAVTVYPIGVLMVIICKFILQKPVFVTVHGTDVLSSKMGLITRCLIKFAMTNASRVFAVSHSTREKTIDKYNIKDSQIKTIRYIFQDNHLGDSNGVTKINGQNLNNKKIILSVSRLVERKGIDVVIRAMKYISKDKIYMIVGEGEKKNELEEVAKVNNVEKRVMFLGYVENIRKVYEMSDIFVLTPRYRRNVGDVEGLGIVFLEAQKYGLPVVGSDSGGVPEAIDDNKSGIVVPENNPKRTANAIEEILDNEDKYDKMSNNGPEFVKNKFGAGKITREYINEYKKGCKS